MDPLGLSAVPALQAGRRRGRRVQRQVHVGPVRAQRRKLRDRARAFARELPQLLLSASALAVHRAPVGEGYLMATNTGIALVDLDEDGVDRAFRADVLA